MTLTLDDVRNKRFRAARKSGYEVLEVDEFVDEVRERFTLLLEDNQNLKKQVEALKSAPPVPAQTPAPLAQAPTVQPPVPQQPNPVRPSASGTIVVTTGKEASAAVVRLVEMSTEQAERLVEEVTADANRIREEANRTAHQLTTDARTVPPGSSPKPGSMQSVSMPMHTVALRSSIVRLKIAALKRSTTWTGSGIVSRLPSKPFVTWRRHTAQTSPATCAKKSRLWNRAARSQTRCRT
jgi:DivIVA domain-containing protein